MRVSFQILLVCTGNICRSPVAERLMAYRIGPSTEIEVTSAGTHALVDHEMDAPSALALRGLGVEPDGHRGRQLTTWLIEDADLVLTATVEHRDTVVELLPASADYCYTMREFAQIGALVAEAQAHRPRRTADELRERVGHIAMQRGHLEVSATTGLNIGDPFGAGLAAARSTAAMISTVVDEDLAALGLPALRKHPLRRSDRRLASRIAGAQQTPG